MTNDDGTEATVDSPENEEALGYVKGLMDDGVAAYSSDLGAGWGGEAFGKQLSAMTIEGSWIGGAMTADFPDVDYTVAELPQGPAGPGTLAFTNCWGIAEASGNKEDAVALVESLTSEDQQLAFADAFGVIPSIESAAEQYQQDHPNYAAVRGRRRLRPEPAVGAGRRGRDRRLQRPARGPEDERPGRRSCPRSRTSCRRSLEADQAQ